MGMEPYPKVLKPRLPENRSGDWSVSRLKEIVADMALAVDHLHHLRRKHIVHRDIKWNNFFIAHDGHVVLSDFGIAKETDCLDAGICGLCTERQERPFVARVRLQRLKARTMPRTHGASPDSRAT
ncbi:unnamed protein product [Vitrella brassicaformis CCMP3155]|uniref:Protein kinase domain-containing protein n=1 Tax=Vitrella brassicaformis (strain CCMP3155) TaxID=1169540 RepID=A0A0G4FXR9_VITBC|nr:unnamed protein product [Vitrella brassicaformis CCMP3155]|eukprot:CEM20113.1 unnamed protein product [Vitrella brassicaformis CCMP3155]